MGYQPRMKSPRASGRGYGTPRHEKAKARGRKHRSVGRSIWEENHVASTEEVADRTLKRLRTLGSQRFASSPYSEHFSRWLMNLTDVLSEFESSPTISADDQFVKERSQILSNVELELEERRCKEVFLEESIRSLSNSKNLLERIKEEYATRAREIEGRKNSEIKRLRNNIDSLRGELDDIARMKAGLFRAISKKAKAQKEMETTQKLNTAQRELALAVQNFTAEQERLRDEYERKRQPVIEQIRDYQKEIEHLETDGSLEDRRVACEALVNAVNALLQRKTSSLQ
jgi:chromosome segregation ATPase